MDAKVFADQLRTTIVDLKAKGSQAIDSEGLIRYLTGVIADPAFDAKEPEAATMARYEAQLQVWVEDRKGEHLHSVEMFKSVIQAGQNALRTTLLMNGGAAAALLAFIGHLATNDSQRVPALAPSLAIFVVGVLCAGLASGTTYLSQWLYADDEKPSHVRWGFGFNIAAILLGLSSLGLFAWGVCSAYRVFAGW